jgi:hypothetical protein
VFHPTHLPLPVCTPFVPPLSFFPTNPSTEAIKARDSALTTDTRKKTKEYWTLATAGAIEKRNADVRHERDDDREEREGERERKRRGKGLH